MAHLPDPPNPEGLPVLHYFVQADEAARLMEVQKLLFSPGNQLALVLADGTVIRATCTEQVQHGTYVYETSSAFTVEAVDLKEST